MSTLALFDLDHTLIPIDSDYEWGQFLVRTGAVDAEQFQARNAQYFGQYAAGTLDPEEYLGFALSTLAQFSPQQLAAMHAQFMHEVIQPALLPAATDLIKQHQDQGHQLAIITATNRFVTEPVAAALGIRDLLAAVPERDASGRITGRLQGPHSQGEGKVVHLNQWLQQQDKQLQDYNRSYFYSDSHNDLPLLSLVSHPVATNPNDKLRAHARAHDWRIIELFDKR